MGCERHKNHLLEGMGLRPVMKFYRSGVAFVEAFLHFTRTYHGLDLVMEDKVTLCSVNGSAWVQTRLIQGIRRGDNVGEDQDTIASIRY